MQHTYVIGHHFRSLNNFGLTCGFGTRKHVSTAMPVSKPDKSYIHKHTLPSCTCTSTTAKPKRQTPLKSTTTTTYTFIQCVEEIVVVFGTRAAAFGLHALFTLLVVMQKLLYGRVSHFAFLAKGVHGVYSPGVVTLSQN